MPSTISSPPRVSHDGSGAGSGSGVAAPASAPIVGSSAGTGAGAPGRSSPRLSRSSSVPAATSSRRPWRRPTVPNGRATRRKAVSSTPAGIGLARSRA